MKNIFVNTIYNVMIIKVSKTEYETNDGIIHQIPFELDEIPSNEEFQKIYDNWIQIFKANKLIECPEDTNE